MDAKPSFISGKNGTGVAPAKQQPAAVAEHDEREARLARLREQYQSGNYQIDAQATAAAIIDAHVIDSRRDR